MLTPSGINFPQILHFCAVQCANAPFMSCWLLEGSIVEGKRSTGFTPNTLERPKPFDVPCYPPGGFHLTQALDVGCEDDHHISQ